MRGLNLALVLGAAAVIAACDRSTPASSSAAEPSATSARLPAQPAAIEGNIVVTGRTLRVSGAVLKDEGALRESLETGSGVIGHELKEHMLSLARDGKAAILSAPMVAVRSGERASVLVGQMGGTAGTLNQTKRSLELGITATALEGGLIDLVVDAKFVQLDNGVEVALADWGAPIGTRARGKTTHRVLPPQTVYIARQVDDDWYVWLAEPRLMEEPPSAPGP
jgi:Flp pilus assembly secretin CpaC